MRSRRLALPPTLRGSSPGGHGSDSKVPIKHSSNAERGDGEQDTRAEGWGIFEEAASSHSWGDNRVQVNGAY